MVQKQVKAQRPWGSWEVLNHADGFKVKLIEVSPGQRLSLQRHKQRIEHWVVIEGEAKVINKNETIVLKKDQFISIDKSVTHRLENHKDKKLRVLEIQLGKYLEEDDIERLEDDYHRA